MLEGRLNSSIAMRQQMEFSVDQGQVQTFIFKFALPADFQGPFPVQHRARLPDASGRNAGDRPHHDHAHRPRPMPSPTPARSCSSSSSCAWCPSANRWRVYAIDLVRATRSRDETARRLRPKICELRGQRPGRAISGARRKGPRSDRGRYHVSYDDIRALFTPILRHRILLNFHAESDRLRQDDILRQVLDWKPAPRE